MAQPFKPTPASQQVVEDTAKVMDRTWETIQEKTFTKWVNSKLTIKDITPISDLNREISDGVRLIQLLVSHPEQFSSKLAEFEFTL